MSVETRSDIKRYPKRILTSFQLGNFIGLMFSQLYSIQMPAFYLDIIGLDLFLYTIAGLIFMVWNMFNDPILGYLSDRSKRLTKRFGKRFPFIMIGALPWIFMPVFLFSAPYPAQIGQVGVFLWYLLFQCLNDTAFSLYDINRIALFPDKFRDTKDRKIAGMITVFLETVGILVGIVVPILIIGEFGVGVGYSISAFTLSIISLIAMLLMIPGVREDKEMKERRARLNEEIETEPFFKGFYTTLKDRNFLAYMLFYLCYTSTMGVVMGTVPYYISNILLLPKEGELIIVVYIIAALIMAPIWYKISFRIGVKKTALAGGIMMIIIALPLFFIPLGDSGIPFMIIVLVIFGAVDGAIISMTMPLFSSVIDNAALETGRRKEGVYNGTNVFFSRIGIAVTTLVFFIMKTYFEYELEVSEPVGNLGVRIQMSIIPMIIISLGVILFWRLFKLTDAKIKENSIKLRELDL